MRKPGKPQSNKARPKQRRTSGVGSEHHEQVLVVAHIRAFYPDVIVAAVPNGGKRYPGEAKKLKAEGVLAGYPDLLIDEARGGYFGYRIEMKRAKVDGRAGRTSADQKKVIKKLRAKGIRVDICHGAKEGIAAFEAYMDEDETRLTEEQR